MKRLTLIFLLAFVSLVQAQDLVDLTPGGFESGHPPAYSGNCSIQASISLMKQRKAGSIRRRVGAISTGGSVFTGIWTVGATSLPTCLRCIAHEQLQSGGTLCMLLAIRLG